MADSKKINPDVALTDEELMEMTGGSSFRIQCQKNYEYKPVYPLYGIIPAPEYGIPVAKYGIQPVTKYGIKPVAKYGVMPLYGIIPTDLEG